MRQHILAVLALPFNVIFVIPGLLWYYFRDLIVFQSHIPKYIGLVILLLGLYGLGHCIKQFYIHGRGTLAPWQPTQHLVVSGWYRYVRNPMITSVLICLFGMACMTNVWPVFGWLVLFFLINTVYFHFVEEVELERKFGRAYRLYKDNVPRWIPRTTPWELNRNDVNQKG